MSISTSLVGLLAACGALFGADVAEAGFFKFKKFGKVACKAIGDCPAKPAHKFQYLDCSVSDCVNGECKYSCEVDREGIFGKKGKKDPKPDPACKTDDDCVPDVCCINGRGTCNDGICAFICTSVPPVIQSCSTNDDCADLNSPPVFYDCNNGNCVGTCDPDRPTDPVDPEPECTADDDCKSDDPCCSGACANGQCILGCDSNCGGGEPECKTSDDCTLDPCCLNGTKDCMEGKCIFGCSGPPSVVQPCSTNEDCAGLGSPPVFYDCVDDNCEGTCDPDRPVDPGDPDPKCTTDDDCKQDDPCCSGSCENGLCVVACQDGCGVQPECKKNADCDNGDPCCTGECNVDGLCMFACAKNCNPLPEGKREGKDSEGEGKKEGKDSEGESKKKGKEGKGEGEGEGEGKRGGGKIKRGIRFKFQH